MRREENDSSAEHKGRGRKMMLIQEFFLHFIIKLIHNNELMLPPKPL